MTPYITAAQYKAWADARGFTYPVDAEVNAAIMLATDFIEANYTFKGEALQSTQQVPTDKVALTDVERAAYQATYLQLLGRLTVDPASLTTAAVTAESRAVGSLSTSTSYAERQMYTTTYPTTSIDRLLRGWVVSGGLGKVVRC